MSAAPHVSVIVPTCGRPGSLRRLLCALAAQQEAGPFEVVVVADGASAAAAGVGDERAWPFPLRIVAQPPSGAAVARNTGAEAARSDLLLFLDDDVEPCRTAIDSHRRFHANHASSIAIGGLTPVPSEQGFIGSALAGWWETMCDGLSDPRHRYTFRDLLTGHCSVPREVFERLGRFDASLRCHEDFEFGYRALEAGVEIRFLAAAEASHHDSSTLDKILARKWDEGFADVHLARKHPRLLQALPLGRPLAAGRSAAAVQRCAVDAVAGHQAIPSLLQAAMWSFERLSMRDKWRSALERAMDYCYWLGVRAAAGNAAAVRGMREPEAAARENGTLLDVDLSCGLETAERQIDVLRPRGLRLSIGAEPVGELADVPGAERLRGVHLRPLLLKTMLEAFTRAAARTGVLPEPLVPLVRGASGSTASSIGSADCAA